MRGGVFELAVVIAIVVGSPGSVEGQLGGLVGRVVEGETKQPVSGAAVILEGTIHRVLTDSLGGFQLVRVPAGRYRLQVRHIGYGLQSVDVDVIPGSARPIQIALTATALALEPLTVDALSAEERRDRGAGYRRSVVTRRDIERAENSNLQFGELLRSAVPTARVHRLNRPGSPVCVELRGGRPGVCLAPAVYLDGVPIRDPSNLYDNLELRTIEQVEVVPAAEAGVIYGTHALYGAILITTRRPGAADGRDERAAMAKRTPNFDWSQDSQRHNTKRVFAVTVAGNALGLAVGVNTAAQCLELRKPAYDGLISDCNAAATVGSGAAALLVPALTSSLASRWSGRTDLSQGEMTPAALGTAMTLLPGYAMVFTGYRNDSDNLKWIGYGMIVVGAPLVATAADYLFRELRGKDRNR